MPTAWTARVGASDVLALVRPSSRPLLQAVGIGLVTSLAVAALYAALLALGADTPGIGETISQRQSLHPAVLILLSVGAAPLVETLMMAGVLEAGRRIPVWSGAAVIGLATWAHAEGRGWFVLGATLAFGVLTAQYLAYRERLGWGWAACGVFITHATINAVGVTVATLAVHPASPG